MKTAGRRYMLIGGFAVIARGGARTTKDIDLLVDASPDNVTRIKRALHILEDHAVDQVADTDIARYAVVRVADEIVVALMALACGIDYASAAKDRLHSVDTWPSASGTSRSALTRDYGLLRRCHASCLVGDRQGS